MLAPGTLIDGKYRIVGLLGEGGMGAVYEGLNLRIERRVAIKVMHPSIARDRALVARFEREAQAAAKIGSNHVVDVLDLGELPHGDRYLVMEFLEGENLHSRVARHKFLAPVDVTHIAIQLLEGLAAAHDAGIVHRDLKPPNVFLARHGDAGDFVKILDFGICKMLSRGSLSDHTGGGDLLGTLPYMSPEQLGQGSQKVDGRADIYSVGVILYRCITGKVPFRGANLIEHARLLKEAKPDDIRELAPGVDADFGKIVHRAIEPDRSKRFSSARELQNALMEWNNRVHRIEHLLSDYLGTRIASDRPSRPNSAPPKATAIGSKEIAAVVVPATAPTDVIETTRRERANPNVTTKPNKTSGETPTPRLPRKTTKLGMKRAPTLPMQNAPTLPEMSKVTPTEPQPELKTTRRKPR